MPKLPEKIEKLVFIKTNKKVIIDKIYYKFPNIVSVKNISFREDPIIKSAQSVDFSMNLFALPDFEDNFFYKAKFFDLHLNKNNKIIDIQKLYAYKKQDKVKIKANYATIRLYLQYNLKQKDGDIQLKILNFKKAKFISKKIFNLLEFLGCDTRQLEQFKDVKGKILFDLSTSFQWPLVSYKDLSINGHIITEKLGFDFNKYNIEYLTSILRIKNSQYSLKNAYFNINDTFVHFDINGNNIFKKPEKINANIQEFDFNKFINLSPLIPHTIKNKPNIYLAFKETLKGYSGTIESSKCSGNIYNIFSYDLDPFELSIEDNILKISRVKLKSTELGAVTLDGQFSSKFYELSLTVKKELILDQLMANYQAIDSLKIKSLALKIDNKDKKKITMTADAKLLLRTALTKEVLEPVFSIRKNADEVTVKLIDKNQKILDFKGKIKNNLLLVSAATIDFFNNGKIKTVGNIPLTINDKFELSLTGSKIYLGFINDFIQKANLKTNFKIRLEGAINNLKMDSDIDIFGKGVKANILAKYQNNKLIIKQILIGKILKVDGYYDLQKNKINFKSKLNGIKVSFFLKTAKSFNLISDKQYQLFKQHLKNQTVRGNISLNNRGLFIDIKLRDREHNLVINFKAIWQDGHLKITELKFFQNRELKGLFQGELTNLTGYFDNLILDKKQYSFKLNLKDEQLTLKNIKVDTLTFNKLTANLEINKQLKVSNIMLDDLLSGDLLLKQTLSGIIRLNNFPYKKINLTTDIQVSGTLISPILNTKNLKVDFDNMEINTDFEYKNKRITFNQGKLSIGKMKKINFKGNIIARNKFNLWLTLDDVSSTLLDKLKKQYKEVELFKYFKAEMINGRVYLSKNYNQYYTSLNLKLKKGRIWKFDTDTLTLKASYDQHKLQIIYAELNKAKSELKLTDKSYFIPRNGLLKLDFYMKDWQMFNIYKGLGSGVISGTLKNKIFHAKLYGKNYWFNKYNFRDKFLKIDYRKKQLKLGYQYFSAQVDFTEKGVHIEDLSYKNLDKELYLKGDISKEKDIGIVFKTKNIDASILTRFLKTGFHLQGLTNINVRATGTLTDPKIEVLGNIQNGNFANMLDFDSLETYIAIKKDNILIKELNIKSGKNYWITAMGLIPFPLIKTEEVLNSVAKNKMFLNIKTRKAKLAILKNILGEDFIKKPKGAFDFDLTLSNSIKNPKYQGSIKIKNGSFGFNEGLKSLKDVNAQLDFDSSVVYISSFNARVGKGVLIVSGYLGLEKFGISNFNITFNMPFDQGIEVELNSLKIPQSSILKVIPAAPSKGDIRGRVNLSGNQQEYKIQGKLDIDDASFTYPPDKGEDADSGDNLDFAYFMKGADLDLKLTAGSNVWFENKFVNLGIEGAMELKKSKDDLKINGAFDIIRGDITYMNRYLKVNEGHFAIVDNEPTIELQAETYIQKYDANFNRQIDDTILLYIDKSKLSDINFRFESQNYPNTTSEEAMGLAFSGGVTEDMSSEYKENYMRQEFFKLIDSSLATPFVKMLVKKTGLVDFVKVNTNIVEKSINQNIYDVNKEYNDHILLGSSFMFGKYLNSNLFVSYLFWLEETADTEDENALAVQHELAAKLKLRKNLYLKGVLEIDKANNRDDKQIQIEYMLPIGRRKK
ncbi:MAG: hypothetical protein GY817_03120 [bacterium]|nr:hypothetical protein [bacterium]